MGFGCFFMHSRTGLVTEYLGDVWFELINACAEEAERLGLEAWLYDEDRWPSGTAGGHTYLDTMNPETVQRFLELTHEKYKERSGKHFGKANKGIFTDEPHRGALMDGFGIANEERHWHAPWTYSLFDRFFANYGYDLLPKLPELFLHPPGLLQAPLAACKAAV